MTTTLETTDRYTIISSDCHAGADIPDYREYLPSRYHDDFDAWVESYENPFGDLVRPERTRNWDHHRRIAELEADGIVAEVIFPNTVPPFFPRVSLVAAPPSAEDFELRWAGLQAHNRWLVDFCAMAPGRRAGVAQILLNDVDAAVAEIEWVKESGLMGGVLLPGVPPDSGLPPLIATEYEPIWNACAELDVPLNHHAGSAGPDYGRYPASGASFIMETSWFAHRALWQLIFAGVFERYPNLRFVITEQGTGWIPQILATLDDWYRRFTTRTDTAESRFGGIAARELSMKPSEYWARQCFVGSSFLRPLECARRDAIGLDKIMWGADYPHTEGTTPYSLDALRLTFATVPPSEVRAMLAENAARVYGFDLALLDPIAARVGPTVAEVAETISLADVPADATSSIFQEITDRPW